MIAAPLRRIGARSAQRFYSEEVGKSVTPPSFFHNEQNIPARHGEVAVAAPGAPEDSKEQGNSDTVNYFQSYKEFCKGMAYLGVGIGVLYTLFDQHERLEESERQLEMMKKKQRDIAVQVQGYKTKLNKLATENAKKNVIVQGKMQMHIALLREQLREAGLEPVAIAAAVQRFEHDVKIDVQATAVDLWVPGDDAIKQYIPDPHEYK